MCIFILILFFYFLCVLEACDTKTNSLYAQADLAIKLFLTSDFERLQKEVQREQNKIPVMN